MTLVCSRAGASRRRRPHEDCRRQGNRSVRAAGRGVAGHGKKIQGAGRRSRDRARRGHQIGAAGFGIHLRRRNRQRRCPQDADIIIKVKRPEASELASYKRGTLVIAIMDPYGNEAALKTLAEAGILAFAMELMPRITRAQVMDVLSSQANLAGYRAVIEAAETFGRAFPMMMTAAGTIPAAKVFVMGVGVAGLQAIATARRLGAVVTATDVRPATKEHAESPGA